MNRKYEEFLRENLKNCTFQDVFDIDEIQELQDEFAYSMQLASVITELDGKPITRPSNFCSYCENYIRKSDAGLKQCMYSDSVLGSADINGYSMSKCFSGGLLDAGVRIMLGDIHIANWLFGQVRVENESIDEEELKNYAAGLNVDYKEFIREYEKVPVISRERFEHIANFAYLVCQKLSIQGYHKCVQQADAHYHAIIEEEMRQEKERLEYANAFDSLTKLYNRNYFERQLEKLQLLGATPIAVIMGDVNHLKLTNDVFGHRHGDLLLQEIADVMLEESFDGYIIGRCGGDEFNVIIPNGNRQDAEWYCHRVRMELKKRFNCCVLPSIAFGVGKKGHREENLKNIMELADIKMYSNKMELKEKEEILSDMRRVLNGRGFISNDYQERAITVARDFGRYLGYDIDLLKMLTRLMRIQDYGYIILEKELFKRRFNKNLNIEEKREIRKHPIIGSKIAKLDGYYAPVSEFILKSHEHWDGSGYPNALQGEEIPELSRIIRILDDYLTAIEQKPVGLGKSRKTAVHTIQKGAGSLYDPVIAKKFLKFIQKYE